MFASLIAPRPPHIITRTILLLALAGVLFVAGIIPSALARTARDSASDFNTLSAAGNTAPGAIWSDGTTMWVANSGVGISDNDKLYAYSMATKARDSTKDFDTLKAAGNTLPEGIWSDGTTMWVADWIDDKLYAYSMTTKARDSAKDFNTLKAAGNTGPSGIWSDGTTMWVADSGDDKLYAYSMATKARDSAKDFNTLSAADNLDSRGIWSDGMTMWVANDGSGDNAKLYAYSMTTRARDASKDFGTLKAAGNTDPRGIWSNSTTMWVADGGDDKLYAYTDRMPVFAANVAIDSQSYTTWTAIKWLTLPEATGGDGTLTYSITPALPEGLEFNATTRTLSGTPTEQQLAKVYRYTATDFDGDSDTIHFEVTVTPSELRDLTIRPVAGKPTELRVSWRAVSGADGYQVRHKTGSDDFGSPTDVTGTTHTITGLTVNTAYTVRVTARHGTGASAVDGDSSEATGATSILVQHHLIDDILIVGWTPSTDSGVTGYLVQWKSGSESYSTTERSHTAGPSDSMHEIDGLALGVYMVRVTQQGGAGDGTSLGEATVTLHGWPGVVYVDPVAGDARAIDVEWEKVSTAAGYVIQWRKGSDSGYPTANRATVAADSVQTRTGTDFPVHRVTGLEPNTVYHAKVTVYTASGTATDPDGLSHEDFGTTHGELTGLTAVSVAGEATSLDVSWSAPVTAVAYFKPRGYRVQWKTTAAADYPSANEATAASDATSHQITGLTAGTGYTVKVTVLGNWYGIHEDGDAAEANGTTGGAGGESGGQEPTGTVESAALTGLTVDSVSGQPTQLAVSWNALDGAAKYSVRWKTGDGGYGSPVETATNSHTITGLSPGTTYTVNVAALDAGNTLLAESVGSGTTAHQTGGAGGESNRQKSDSTPAAVFVIYHNPGTAAAADRYNEAVKLLTDAGIAYSEVVGDVQADVDRLAGVTNSIIPRFFLGDPNQEGWTSQIKVNNGGLRWLKAKVAELTEE